MQRIFTMIFSWAICLEHVAWCQIDGTTIPGSTPSLLTTIPLLDVQLQASRPLTLGEPRQGIFATLRNNSSWDMRFRPDRTVFVLTPDEGGEQGTLRGCGEFPTITKPNETLTLAPNDSTTVVWNLSPGNCGGATAEAKRWFDWQQVRAGMYKVIMNAQFEIDKTDKQAKTGKVATSWESHSVTRIIEARFAAALSIVLLWAFVGGVAGKWVQTFVQTNGVNFVASIRQADKPRELIAWVGSGAMSAVLVVLGTQLADTAFPVKVDASSTVGSFTSGFLLHFAGDKILSFLKS